MAPVSKILPTAPIRHLDADELNETSEIVRHLQHVSEIETPLVLLSAEKLKENYTRLARALPGAKIFYAVKANPELQVLKLLDNEGAYFDVASSGEIAAVEQLGISGSRLLLSNPIKDRATVSRMLRYPVTAFTVDCVEELQKIAKVVSAHRPDVFIRFRTESKKVQLDLNEKFGCALSDVKEIAACAQQLGFNVRGLSFHVGTQSLTADNYRVALEHCYFLSQLLEQNLGIHIKTLNIGGGFCDVNYARLHGVDGSEVLTEVGFFVREAQARGFEIIAEPGRAMLTDVATLVAEVIGVRRLPGALPMVHITDGIYGTLSLQTYEQVQYSVQTLPYRGKGRPHTSHMIPMKVVGRTCDSIDTLTGTHLLPEDVQVGDLVSIANVGAYTTALASMFNGFDIPLSILYQKTDDGYEFGAENSSAAVSIPLKKVA